MERNCPKCGGPVISELGCHTWPKQRTIDNGHLYHSANEAHPGIPCPEPEYTEQWVACMPCDSATIWYCAVWTDDDELDEWMIKGEDTGSGCGWRWNSNLNKGNPRSEENNRNEPEWA